jgi:putative membrane protein
MGGMMGGFGGYGTFGWIGMILNLVITIGVIVGFVLLIVWAVRRFSNEGRSSISSTDLEQSQASPREILEKRYARGEITREQFKEILSDIG